MNFTIETLEFVPLKHISQLHELGDSFSLLFRVQRLLIFIFPNTLLENLLDDLPSNVEKLLQLSRCFEFNLFFDTLALEKLKEYFFFGFHFHLLLGCSITVSEDSDH